jgi:hypothetical protein
MYHYNELGKTAYKIEDFAIIPTLKYYDYLPERLERYSPYPEDHNYTDVIDAVKKPRGEVQVIEPINKITLSEAEEILNAEFDKAIQSNDNNIYIFSTQTAIGKTTKLAKLNKTTLAFPTHDLKDEIGCKMEVEHLIVPEIPIFRNKLVNEQIKSSDRTGTGPTVSAYRSAWRNLVFTKNGPSFPGGVIGGYDPMKQFGGEHSGFFHGHMGEEYASSKSASSNI